MQPGRRKRLQAFGEGDVDIGPTPHELGSGKRFLQRLQVADAGRHLDLRNRGRWISGAQQRHDFVRPGGGVCQVGFPGMRRRGYCLSRGVAMPYTGVVLPNRNMIRYPP